MGAPRVSIILPVRNAAQTLGPALESLQHQTFTDFEIVAIENGSTDDTATVLAQFSSREPRLRVLTLPSPGLPQALNAGLAAARGELIARMDADDEALPRRLELSVAALEADAGLSGVGTQVEITRHDRPVSPNLQRYQQWLNSLTTPELLFRERYLESPLCHPSVLIRRTALEAMNGWRAGPFPEDWDLWLRLLESGHSLRAIEPVLLRWKDHDRRATREDPRYSERAIVTLKAEHLMKRFAGQPVSICGAGRVGRQLVRLFNAQSLKVSELFSVNPRHQGQQIHGARVLHFDSLQAPADRHLLVAVGAMGEREILRAQLRERGWVEGRHFTCVA